MVKLKSIRLKNYCGYKDTLFDFTNNGDIKQLICFFGPNGCGKSTMLHAIETVSNVYRYYGKNTELLFRKLTYHPDYDPGYSALYKEDLKEMEITGLYDTEDGEKEVIVATTGVKKNELYRKDRMSFHFFTDADNPINLYRFQLHSEMKDKFLDLAHTVYGYDCYMGSEAPDLIDQNESYYTDFIIDKTHINGTKVHFKRMSGGEKKIATLLRDLCNPLYMDTNDIILIDNIAKEIYFERHTKMIDKLLEMFPTKQFFIVTHSPVLVGCRTLGIEPYLPDKYLYEIEEIKKQQMVNIN